MIELTPVMRQPCTVSRPMYNTNRTSPHSMVVEVTISFTNIGSLVLKIYTYIQLQPSWHPTLFLWGEMIYDTIIELTSGLQYLNDRWPIDILHTFGHLSWPQLFRRYALNLNKRRTFLLVLVTGIIRIGCQSLLTSGSVNSSSFIIHCKSLGGLRKEAWS